MSNNNTNSPPLDKTFEYNKCRLKPTDYVRSWVENKVREYGQQIGIAPQEIPLVVFSRKEVLAMPKELTAGRRTVTHKCLGICFRKARTILINVKKHTTYPDLRHTIVHELVHYRFRYLKHGIRFENRISLILRGKRYGVKALYPGNLPLPSSYKEDHENTLQDIYLQQSCHNYTLVSDAKSRLWLVNHLGDL
ncbi:MAG TPA: hypothetical protein VJ729_12670 [Nitrososphaeraceae archaeon]|nr:hypothetical protein [Nitrososphaeraceae archaeon]